MLRIEGSSTLSAKSVPNAAWKPPVRLLSFAILNERETRRTWDQNGNSRDDEETGVDLNRCRFEAYFGIAKASCKEAHAEDEE